MKSKLYLTLILVSVTYSLLIGCAKKGAQGIAGSSCTVTQLVGGAMMTCPDGSSATWYNGQDGIQGPVGPQGPQGEPGIPGEACAVQQVGNYINIICESSTAQMPVGTIIETIQLCPNMNGGVFREYLLRIGNDLYGVYASGSNIGLAKLWPGNWHTTDGRNCNFTVYSNLTVGY